MKWSFYQIWNESLEKDKSRELKERNTIWASELGGAMIDRYLKMKAIKPTNPPNNLWKGIIGEATSEGYIGMYAVACVYRNRLEKGMSLGCVALKRRDLDEFVRREGRKAEFIAKSIIEEVFKENGKDITKGATHYENIQKFGIPKWAKKMVTTVFIGSHTFFKAR
jgi:hypothetical protein